MSPDIAITSGVSIARSVPVPIAIPTSAIVNAGASFKPSPTKATRRPSRLSVYTGPNSVNRENTRRRIVIRCNTEGRDLAGAVGDIKQRITEQVQMPVGYFIEYGGQFESQQRATQLIIVLAGISVVGMFIVLLILFPSVRIVLQILNALPTAFIGGVMALVITQQSLTVASLVGFISLGGIACRIEAVPGCQFEGSLFTCQDRISHFRIFGGRSLIP